MKRVRNMIIKEFLQIRRDKRMLPVILILPIIQVILLGYAATVDVKNIGLAVNDMDNSPESRELVQRFTNTGYFEVIAHTERLDNVDEYLDNSTATIAILLPLGFGESITTGKPAAIQLIADGADANTANISLTYARQIIGGFAQEIVAEQFVRRSGVVSIPSVQPEVRVWFNPDLRSANYMVPGVVAMILMIITATFTSAALVKEKEIGTMEQLLVTPMRSSELLMGKMLPYVIIGLVDVALVLGVAILWFGIPLKGSAFLLFFLSGLFILTTLGIGLFVSTISHTQQQALMTAQFFVFFPMIFLSGFAFPIENMPEFIQGITYIVPLRYFLEIIRGLFLKGVGMEVLWPQTLALVAFGVTIMGLSINRFQKRIS